MWPDENWVTTETHSVELSWVESGRQSVQSARPDSTQRVTNRQQAPAKHKMPAVADESSRTSTTLVSRLQQAQHKQQRFT